jgi:hypothetical protein
MNQFTYEIRKLPADAGAGWRLRLLDNGRQVADRAIHVSGASPAYLTAWWTSLSKGERDFWIRDAGTVQLEGVYHAYRNAQAYLDARTLASAWIRSREGLRSGEGEAGAGNAVTMRLQ